MLKIDKYEFEDHPEYDVQLYATREDKELGIRIIGSFINENNTVIPFTVDNEGNKGMWVENQPINLTPYDKFKDLKRVHSEGAIIEFDAGRGWKICKIDFTATIDCYRIKDNVSIESWNKHKDLIKLWWDGAEIEYFDQLIEEWITVHSANKMDWNINREYRVKSTIIKMSIKEIEEKLGIENLEIVR